MDMGRINAKVLIVEGRWRLLKRRDFHPGQRGVHTLCLVLPSGQSKMAEIGDSNPEVRSMCFPNLGQEDLLCMGEAKVSMSHENVLVLSTVLDVQWIVLSRLFGTSLTLHLSVIQPGYNLLLS